MPITYNSVTAMIDLARLRANFELLNGRGGNCWPVIKADAYGHGLIETAAALEKAGADTFCVGTVQEACELRQATAARIIALLGPLADADYGLAVEHGIVPFVCRLEQIARLDEAARAAGRRSEVGVKFDTGMRRLGFAEMETGAVREALLQAEAVDATIVASHLATADDPAQHSFVDEQAAAFSRIVSTLRGGGLLFEASLANSGAILSQPDALFDAQRPGISLYGANPFIGTDMEHLGEGLVPAMSVSAPVVQVHPLRAGQSVSYGRTYTADADKTVAVVAAGYADCYSRNLSSRGEVCIRGMRAPILGRVCMQLTIVDVSRIMGASAGDTAWLLGGEGEGIVTPDDLAAWWGTITYEVFCLLGMNRRVWV